MSFLRQYYRIHNYRHAVIMPQLGENSKSPLPLKTHKMRFFSLVFDVFLVYNYKLSKFIYSQILLCPAGTGKR